MPDRRIVAVEEHFMHDTLVTHFPPGARHQPDRIRERLFDMAGLRVQEMDAAGIDGQILSHQSPGSQRLSPEVAIEACRAVNDALAAVVREAPDRFQGFAMVPSTVPEAMADELARAVGELGLKGAMIHGLTRGAFADGETFEPLYARAAALGVPVYLHPALPDREVTARYYAPYDESHPMFIRAAWGFGVEAGTQAIRLVLSGVFERHPDLRILLGHMGEALPFWLDRIDASLARPGSTPANFAEVFRRQVWVTTSGFFSDRALECTVDAMGADRVLYAVDWPYAANVEAVERLPAYEMAEADKA
ncbi:MAG: amidohydrolase family protein, partial [Geminicoccaceae bacterium]